MVCRKHSLIPVQIVVPLVFKSVFVVASSLASLVYKSSGTKVHLTFISFVYPLNLPSTLNFETGEWLGVLG